MKFKSINEAIVSAVALIIIKDLRRKNENVITNVLGWNYPIHSKLSKEEYLDAYSEITNIIISSIKEKFCTFSEGSFEEV